MEPIKFTVECLHKQFVRILTSLEAFGVGPRSAELLAIRSDILEHGRLRAHISTEDVSAPIIIR